MTNKEKEKLIRLINSEQISSEVKDRLSYEIIHNFITADNCVYNFCPYNDDEPIHHMFAD